MVLAKVVADSLEVVKEKAVVGFMVDNSWEGRFCACSMAVKRQ